MASELRQVRRPPRPRLDDGCKGYYKRVESYLDGEEGENGGDNNAFLSNVVDQVISDGLRLVCSDKDGSRALERLIQHSSMTADSLRHLMKSATPVFFKLCLNQCGSHVIEALVHAACHTLSEDRTDTELLDIFLSWVSIIEDKISDFIQHHYASHVLGGVVQDLGGVKLAEQIGRSRYSQEFRKAKMVGVTLNKQGMLREVPDIFIKHLDGIAKKVGRLPNLRDMLTHHNGSPVLQSILQVLALRAPQRNVKLTKKLVKLSEVLKEEEVSLPVKEEEMSLPDMFTDLVGSHLIEVMVQSATSDLQLLIFTTCLKGRVMRAALHPIANFPLQHMIASASPQLLKDIVVEVSSIEEVLFIGHTGVVVKLLERAAVCGGDDDVQPSLLDALMKAFHLDNHLNCIVPVLLALMTYEIFHKQCGEEEGEGGGGDPPLASSPPPPSLPQPITLHGSLFVQALLKFQDTRLVVRSMSKLDQEELTRISCDSNGSHVLISFMNSVTVPPKKKEKIMKKLERSLVLLCMDKYGSRVVDVLWRLSEVKKKEELATILLANEEELASDFHGSIVLRNCNITHFRKKQEGWVKSQEAVGRRQEIFQDILGDQSTLRNKKRKLSGLTDDKTKKRKT